jgi:hypothetical protein
MRAGVVFWYVQHVGLQLVLWIGFKIVALTAVVC